MKLTSLAMLAASLSAAGCAATPLPEALPWFNPSDPAAGLTPGHYHPVVSGYRHREPVDPQNWRQLNDRLSPATSGGTP